MKKLFALACVAFFSLSSANAQLTVSGGYTAQQLAEYLAGPNVTVFNATLTGAAISYGKFDGGNATNLGLNSGVVLTSGSRNYLLGPNNTTSKTGVNNTAGDNDLTLVANQQTLDATVLEFQFEVQTESIEFSYVFGSDEYTEFIDGQYNDVFAFFISGPGISGKENIALIPNTTTPVVTNTVNSNSYWQYYIDNPWVSGSTDATKIQYDGFTTVLKAKKSGLIPCEIYTLKLAIADGAGNISDNTWDSGVMLQAGSLKQGTVSAISNTIQADSVALEGCVKASFTFSLDSAKLTHTEIKFNISGSAINGVDYAYIDSIFTIPAGQTSATIFIDPLNDGYTEGRETVMLIYSPQPCTPADTVMLYIDDTQPLNFSLSGVNPACNGDSTGEIYINTTGGFPPYTYTVMEEGDIYTSSPITNMPAGFYTIKVDDSYGCKADAVAIGSVFDAGATFLPDGNGQSYTSSITISGFTAGQTLDSISQLQSICANLEHSSMGELEIVLIAPDGTEITLKEQPGGTKTNLGEPVAKAPIDGGNSDTTPGVGYDYCWTMNPTFGTMVSEAGNYNYTYVTTTGDTQSDTYLPSGSYQSFEPLTNLVGVPLNGTWTIRITDTNPQDNGYIFNWGISLKAGMPDSTITLTEPVMPVFAPSSSSVITQPSCGSANGAIDITVTGNNGPYGFAWSNGATTEDISALAAGSYTITITDATPCAYDTTFLLQNISTLSLSTTHTDVTCPGANNGSINLTASGGTKPYTYSWSNGAATEDISSLSPGTYTVTVTDNSGCLALTSADIIEIPAIDIQAVTANETCGTENGTIDLSITGGTTPYTFSWSNGSTTEDLQYLQAGTYTVTVRDANNCSKTQSFSLINEVNNCVINCDIAISSISVTDETCGNGQGAIDITTVNGTQPYTYAWSNGAATEDLTSLSAGTYTVTVKDVNDCEIIENFTVNNNTGTLALGTASITSEICGNGQGAVDISVSGGAMPYIYSWSNGAATEDISTLSAGDYTITVRDANNCILSSTYTVTNNSGTLTQTYGNAMDEVCNNNRGSIDITISGGQTPYYYSWSNGATTQDLTNLSEGTYSAVITDANNCRISTPDYIVNNNSGTLAIFDIDVTDETCGNGQGRINVDPTGGTTPYTYAWSTGQNTQSISSLSAGTYSATVTDAGGCSVSTGSITVLNSTGTLALDNIVVTDETCNNNLGAIDITISGGATPYIFDWSNGATTEDLTNLNEGSYSATVTDANGCSLSAGATVSNTSGTLALTNLVVTDETCGNGTGAADITISGGTTPYTFNWSNGAATEDLVSLSAGIYNVQITDAGGCEISASAEVKNNAGTLAMGTPAVTNEVCGDASGSINISVSGGSTPYTYIWSNGATTEDISGLIAGTYSVEVTDALGCIINSGDITINNSSAGLLISLNSITDESCGNNGGAVDILVSGGTSPFTYLWSNGAATQDISGVAAGTYTITVTDNAGCSTSKTYNIINNGGTLSVTGAAITNEMCGNGSGAIDLTLSGGTTPYTFNWSNGASTEDISSLSAGDYSATISDASGCSVSTGTLTVNNSSGTLNLDNIFVIDEQCGNGIGEVDITVSGGTAPLTYTWSNGATTEDIAGLNAGTYTVTVADNAGCSFSASATVMNKQGNLTVDNQVITNATCGNANGGVDLTIVGGTTPYSYLWSNGATTEDIAGLSGGTYNYSISDANGCILTGSATIANVAGVAITGITITDEICGSGTGAVDISVSGGATPVSYSWSNGQSTQDISNLSAGTYTVTITDGSGCTALTSGTVSNSTGTLAVTGVVTSASCGNNNGSINITVTGGNTPYYYYWSNGSTSQDIYNLSAGTYTCTIYDGSGCSINYSATVTSVSSAIVVNNIAVTNELCGNNQGAVDITISGGTTPYGYAWSNGQTTEDINGISAGTYTCTVTDSYGCVKTLSATVSNTIATITVTAAVTDEACGNGQGAVDITASGGAAPYTYSWSNGQTTEDITGLSAGTYTVTVADANGCAKAFSATVSNGSGSLAASESVTNATCGDSTGAVDLTITGGTSPYTVTWSNGAVTEDISGLVSGVYTYQVNDAGSCSLSDTVFVGGTANNISVSTNITPELCGNSNGSIDVTATGGSAPYSYVWSNGQTTEDISGLTADTYACTVTDAGGCEKTFFASVGTATNNLAISVISVSSATCGGALGAINIAVSGGVTPYSYLWSSGHTTEDISGLSAGIYTCVVTDGIGCTATTYVSVSQSALFTVSAIVNNPTCSSCSDGSINLSLSSGAVQPVTYSWSHGATTEDVDQLPAGLYTVTVTDATGCSLIMAYTVGVLTSIAEAEQDIFEVYPNPSKGIIKMRWENLSGEDVAVEVYNLLGEILLSESYNAPAKGEEKVIDMSGLSNGTYLMRVNAGTHQQIKKIVILK